MGRWQRGAAWPEVRSWRAAGAAPQPRTSTTPPAPRSPTHSQQVCKVQLQRPRHRQLHLRRHRVRQGSALGMPAACGPRCTLPAGPPQAEHPLPLPPAPARLLLLRGVEHELVLQRRRRAGRIRRLRRRQLRLQALPPLRQHAQVRGQRGAVGRRAAVHREAHAALRGLPKVGLAARVDVQPGRGGSGGGGGGGGGGWAGFKGRLSGVAQGSSAGAPAPAGPSAAAAAAAATAAQLPCCTPNLRPPGPHEQQPGTHQNVSCARSHSRASTRHSK